MKLKTIIVDDDPLLTMIMKDLCKGSSLVEVTHTFSDSVEFVRNIGKLEFDLCLLDIEMPGMDGLEVAQSLHDKAIIFVTGKYEFLKDALDVPHIDVVTKPIHKERLYAAFETAHQKVFHHKMEEDCCKLFTVSGGRGCKVRLKLEDIYYVGVSKDEPRNKHVWTKEGEHYLLADCTLEEFKALVPTLLQVNISELVSRDAVHMIENDKLILRGVVERGRAKEVILARTYKNTFLESMDRMQPMT